MKKLTLFISVLVFPIIMYSQVYEPWSAPVALTDTLSYNANPVVISIPDYGYGDTFMFYEKKGSPEANRQIWWKRISDEMGEEQMFLGAWPEVDYRNPQVIHGNFLIFECNVFGNYDLFGVAFDQTGATGNSFQLTSTPYDENSFRGAGFYCWHCCWESQGNILLADIQYSQDTLLFTDFQVLDSVNCSNPVYNDSFVAWQKMVGNESHIYFSENIWPTFEWSDPDTLYATGNNVNLSISGSLFMEGWSLSWENTGQIYYCETFGANPSISVPVFPGIENYYEPTAFDLVFITDNLPVLFSFTGETNDARDIYIADQMISSDPINITNDDLINKNPGLFGGRMFAFSYEVVNIWQTEINGYDVLFKSQAAYILGDVKEQNSGKPFKMKLSPNPFHEKTTLSFYPSSNEDVEINIYDSFGRKHYTTTISHVHNGLNEFTWKTDKNLANGLYYVEIRQGKLRGVMKVLRTN